MAQYEYEGGNVFKYTLDSGEEILLSDSELKEIVLARNEASTKGWDGDSLNNLFFSKENSDEIQNI